MSVSHRVVSERCASRLLLIWKEIISYRTVSELRMSCRSFEGDVKQPEQLTGHCDNLLLHEPSIAPQLQVV